jgi:tartrate/fumarate subfamily iron-sulfur-dependent hydro-lyase beta chain
MVNKKFKAFDPSSGRGFQSSKLKIKKTKIINLPLTKDEVLLLHVGDMVLINGQIVTGRDRVHKFLFNEKPTKRQIPFNLKGTVLYHCGPIIRKTGKDFKLIAGGPTTSIRVEMYEHEIISEYGIRGVMGKGGMGKQTLNALKESGCVYLHTIGGAAVYLADRVKKVVDVWKLKEFGMTEAMWVFDVKEFPAIVTMDAHGRSLHEEIEKKSYGEFKRLVGLG